MSIYGECPPERYSVADDLQKPHALRIGKNIDVFLDGKPQSGVISYDVAAGTIERLATDDDGRLILEGDEVKRERLAGVVEVRWKAADQCLG